MTFQAGVGRTFSATIVSGEVVWHGGWFADNYYISLGTGRFSCLGNTRNRATISTLRGSDSTATAARDSTSRARHSPEAIVAN